MNREDIIKMAQDAGFQHHHNVELWDFMLASDEAIERFATLVAAAEREALIDIVAMHGGSVEIEAAIRARGEKND